MEAGRMNRGHPGPARTKIPVIQAFGKTRLVLHEALLSSLSWEQKERIQVKIEIIKVKVRADHRFDSSCESDPVFRENPGHQSTISPVRLVRDFFISAGLA
jgi:hypothetical protein